jgi:carboxymethylenebutenolidase
MCYGLTAEPPAPPVSGGAARGEELMLTSPDGTSFAAYAAHVDTATPAPAGIVILPDVRGLFRFYQDLALQFARAGIEAIAIDYFGRTAGASARGEDFDYWPHVQQTKPETVAMDTATAVAYLRAQPGAAARSVFTVGFCFGGRNAYLQGLEKHGLAGVIGFYGQPGIGRDGTVGPTQRASEFQCPVLGFFGGADQGISQEAVQQFDQALTTAGVQHELITYPGAPHSFFDRHQGEYAEASHDAWHHMLDFIQANTK